MKFVPSLLGNPQRVIDRCLDPAQQRNVVKASLFCLFLGGALFGACAGMFRGGTQVLAAALKIPVATLLSLAVAGPAIATIARAFGRDYGLRATFALLLSAGARSSLVLLCAVPALWLVIDLGAGYGMIRGTCVLAYGLAAASGLALLLRALGPAPGRFSAALISIAVYGIVGAQSAWVLRPYLGDPSDETVPIFAHGRTEGGVAGVLGRDLGLLERRRRPSEPSTRAADCSQGGCRSGAPVAGRWRGLPSHSRSWPGPSGCHS